ncbi:13357_t:CDS:2, partial [Racocetra persica]
TWLIAAWLATTWLVAAWLAVTWLVATNQKKKKSVLVNLNETNFKNISELTKNHVLLRLYDVDGYINKKSGAGDVSKPAFCYTYKLQERVDYRKVSTDYKTTCLKLPSFIRIHHIIKTIHVNLSCETRENV